MYLRDNNGLLGRMEVSEFMVELAVCSTSCSTTEGMDSVTADCTEEDRLEMEEDKVDRDGTADLTDSGMTDCTLEAVFAAVDFAALET